MIGSGAMDIAANIEAYLGQRRSTDRYTSFDYCFNYFRSYQEQGRIGELTVGPSLQLSCLHLGFYLASWGMYRGSSELLQHSAKHLAPVITAIADAPASIWRVDVNDYTDDVCAVLVSYAGRLRRALPDRATDTLVTKIMLGVFACVPAFDTNFKKGSGLSSFSRDSLLQVAGFYRAHQGLIDGYRVPTLDFDTGEPTSRRYSRAKVIDMVFFVEGSG